VIQDMNKDSIVIRFENDIEAEYCSAIIIPERAINEPGHIRTLSINSTANSKHEFHAITQIVLSEFQDDEIELEAFHAPLTIQCNDEIVTMTSGVIILRDLKGKLHLIGNLDQNIKKLLQSAHRFCTRWVRLDI